MKIIGKVNSMKVPNNLQLLDLAQTTVATPPANNVVSETNSIPTDNGLVTLDEPLKLYASLDTQTRISRGNIELELTDEGITSFLGIDIENYRMGKLYHSVTLKTPTEDGDGPIIDGELLPYELSDSSFIYNVEGVEYNGHDTPEMVDRMSELTGCGEALIGNAPFRNHYDVPVAKIVEDHLRVLGHMIKLWNSRP